MCVHVQVLLKRCAVYTFTETVLSAYHLTNVQTYASCLVCVKNLKIFDAFIVTH